MAIRVSKSLSSQTGTGTGNNSGNTSCGLSLKFTDGIEYDLEELSKLYDREDGSTPLRLEVKMDLAEKAITEMKDTYHYRITSSLDNETVTNAIYEEIKAVFRQYHYQYNSVTEELYLDKVHNKDIPIQAYRDLNRRINKKLNEFYNDNNIAYFISFDHRDAGDKYTITYNFISSDVLKTEFAFFYDKFVEEYKKKMVVEDEGGMAIDGTKGNITVTKSDFGKYLLSDDPSSKLNDTTYDPGERAVQVIWEEISAEDGRTQEELPKTSIYDTIQDMQDTIDNQRALLEEYINNQLSKLEFEEEERDHRYVLDLKYDDYDEKEGSNIEVKGKFLVYDND